MRSLRLAFFLLPVVACSGRRAANHHTPDGGSQLPTDAGANPSRPEASASPVLDFEVLAGQPDVPESKAEDPPYDHFTAASVIGPEVVAWSRVEGKEVDGKSAGEVVRLNLDTRARTSLAGSVWGTDARIFEMGGKLVASGRTLLFENDGGSFDEARPGRSAAALAPNGWLLSTGVWGATTTAYRNRGCAVSIDVETDMNKDTAFVAGSDLYFVARRPSGPTLFRVAPGNAACGSTTTATVAKDWSSVSPVGVVGSDDEVYVLGAAQGAAAFGVSEFSLYTFTTPALDLAPFVERLRTFESTPALAKDRSNIYVGWGDGRIDRLDLRTKTRSTFYQASRRVISLASDGVSVIFTTDVGVYRKRL